MFGCLRVIAHSLVRRFEQTGISIDAQDRREVRKQRQDKTIIEPVHEISINLTFLQV